MEVSTLPRRGGGILSHPRQVLKAFSDDRLVEQIRRGNEAAFEVVYERHHRGILSFCRHMLSSQEEGEDVVQHTFVAAYYDIRSSDKEIKLKPWLYTIARNRCLSVLRARREQAAELEEIPTTGLSEAVQQRDELRRMLADMQGLPVEQRAALVLSELGDLSHADIAAVLGVPTLKVKSLVFQARSSLIESRDARDTSCEEIREQLATLRGGALRRGHLKKHLNACPGCRDFRDEVRRQRTAMAAILPVVPSAGLKGTVMAAIGGGGAAGGGAAGLGAGTAAVAGGSAAGGSAGVGGFASLLGGAGVVKLAATAVVAVGAAGGAAVVIDDGRDRPAEPASERAKERSNAAAAPAADPRRGTPADGGAVAQRERKKAKEKKAKKDKERPTLILNPDGTITVAPGSGGGNAYGRRPGGPATTYPGNSNGANGTRARGNPPANSNGRGRAARPATPPRSPNADPPVPPAPPTSTDSGSKSEGRGRGSRGPKVPLPLPLP